MLLFFGPAASVPLPFPAGISKKKSLLDNRLEGKENSSQRSAVFWLPLPSNAVGTDISSRKSFPYSGAFRNVRLFAPTRKRIVSWPLFPSDSTFFVLPLHPLVPSSNFAFRVPIAATRRVSPLDIRQLVRADAEFKTSKIFRFTRSDDSNWELTAGLDRTIPTWCSKYSKTPEYYPALRE